MGPSLLCGSSTALLTSFLLVTSGTIKTPTVSVPPWTSGPRMSGPKWPQTQKPGDARACAAIAKARVCAWECLGVRVRARSVIPTLRGPVDCSLPGSSVRQIFQARVLGWVARPSSRGSSRPREQTRISRVSCVSSGFFTTTPTVKASQSLIL